MHVFGKKNVACAEANAVRKGVKADTKSKAKIMNQVIKGGPAAKMHERGAVSLLALLIMLAVAAVGLSITFIVLGEVESTQDYASSIKAYYGSETALEKGLKIVTEKRFAKADLAEAINALENISGELETADYAIKEANNNSITQVDFDLGWQQTKTIDIFDPDNPTANQGAGVGSVRIEWNDSCTQSSWLEVSAVKWTDIWDDSDANFAEKFYYSCGFGTPEDASKTCAAISSTPFASNENYQVRIKNTSNQGDACSISDARFTAYEGTDASGDTVALANRVFIKAVGEHGNSQQTLSATFPWIAPASGLLDFVLFSEEVIEK